MDRLLQERLRRLRDSGEEGWLREGRKGIEKESLRVTPQGQVAHTPHPRGLGSALTHPHITMDFSEALLELVTPPLGTLAETLDFLMDIHRFVSHQLGEEMLWATSMPCAVSGEDDVPIASFGTSNVGTMKRVYRIGLGHRYGRVMQAISGVHFNYSVPQAFWAVYQTLEGAGGPLQDFVSARYLELVRSFRRTGWLVLYLFGASPAVCQSFLGERDGGLDRFDMSTRFAPHATSLRMSDIGYNNKVQARLSVSANSLEEYIAALTEAIATPWPAYEKIGVVVDGQYRQLSANILQIENEYYSLMRPKRIARSGEKPTHALRRGGVEYVEMRALDVSCFDPIGVNEPQLRFLEAMLLMCLLRESPPIGDAEQEAIDRNQREVARRGRAPGLTLERNARAVRLSDWAAELIEDVRAVCELLDQGEPGQPYAKALEQQAVAVSDPQQTPSARILDEMRVNHESFFEFAMRMSERHAEYLRVLGPPQGARADYFRAATGESIRRQAEIEAGDDISFEQYLERYFAQR